MTLDAILADIATSGWLVNNLFQRDDGSWQCNLRSAPAGSRYYITGFALGLTPQIALELALDAIVDAIEVASEPACAVMEPALADSVASALANLLKPRTPTQPIDRRGM